MSRLHYYQHMSDSSTITEDEFYRLPLSERMKYKVKGKIKSETSTNSPKYIRDRRLGRVKGEGETELLEYDGIKEQELTEQQIEEVKEPISGFSDEDEKAIAEDSDLGEFDVRPKNWKNSKKDLLLGEE